jgi:hypothetical protein
MKRWSVSMIAIAVLLGIGVTIFPAVAHDDNRGPSVSVAFGRGLNTNQPGNVVNHVIIPKNIRTELDGVVHFFVAGFHQVVVYRPGTQPEDIVVPTTGTFINDETNRYYLGINPGGGPLGTAGTIVPFSNSQNRLESVSFPASVGTGTPASEQAVPGTYLVICNVRQHFLDGMFAFVRVE